MVAMSDFWPVVPKPRLARDKRPGPDQSALVRRLTSGRSREDE